jgi:hypothetical protein
MSEKSPAKKQNQVELSLEGISESQKRLLKSLHHTIVHILTTKEESEYFEGSAEVMRMVASIIKQASFNTQLGINQKIPYAEQALEFSIDVLNDHIEQSKIITYDN